MGPKKTLERIKYSFFWEGLRADVKKFCESCKECQLTRSVRIKDRSSSTPGARSELPFQVVNMDLIGPNDPPSSKGHTYILCLVDQHTRWGEARPVTSFSAKVTREALLKIFSRTGIYLLLKREGFVEMNSAASWVTVLDLWKWDFCRSLTKNYAACFMSFGICMTKKVRFKIEYTSYGCGACKEQLPEPGNRSNERRYREKDLATTEEKKGWNGEKREGDEKNRGREKVDTAERCIVISATCTCPAGSTPTFCKHVFALLHAINDYIAKKLYEAPTERIQTWHQPKPIKMVPQTSEELFMREPAIAVENEIGVANFEALSTLIFKKKDEVLTNIPDVRYGLKNEDYVRYTVQQRNPHYVVRKTGLIVHPIQQYIAASPDGLIRSGEDYMIMEIKCLYNPEGHSLQELINKRRDFCL
ncbi:retrovirus-related Pol polyprotein from transposon opus [Trichonephila clavipes]|nr:retrovirus-related Pol polyprotein from transposon opus [Trichonephila clavipes]